MPRSKPYGRGRLGVAALAAVVVALAGCGIQIPADPDGTLDSVENGTLRVGVAAEPGLAEYHDGEAAGTLVDVAHRFAQELNADIEWSSHSEERLVAMLEGDDLDLALGGFTDSSPWSDRVGMTRPVTGIPGTDDPIVMLVPMGENAFLDALERHLDAETTS
ncbi:hypothetical protein [uncultured Agrococcus sp.]|uniref:transporter substrate-binding domain-containing protein n=1 Tax=uncultured Agrococcus sp. TaxID=382258 RepID=UPI0025CFAF86|nr:hypothetical protein [uncultured Agrococcus sp.]